MDVITSFLNPVKRGEDPAQASIFVFSSTEYDQRQRQLSSDFQAKLTSTEKYSSLTNTSHN